mgnify:CR=1 FL=1
MPFVFSKTPSIFARSKYTIKMPSTSKSSSSKKQPVDDRVLSVKVEPLKLGCGVILTFSKPMNFDNLPDPGELFEVKITPFTSKFRRDLLASKTITVSDPEGVSYTWTVTQISPTELKLEVTLEKPYDISQGGVVHVL